MVRWKGGSFLVLFKGEGCRVSRRFYFLFLTSIKGTKRQVGFKKFCMALGMERLSLHLLQAIRNIVYPFKVGCRGAWSL